MLLLAAPALGLSTAAPGIDELPTSNEARQSAERIERTVGPGWEAPFFLVAATREGPITTPERLDLLSRWQRRIARQPGVRAVIGPAPITAGTAPLRDLGGTLASGRVDDVARLGRGCGEPPTGYRSCAGAWPRERRGAPSWALGRKGQSVARACSRAGSKGLRRGAKRRMPRCSA